jgi:hypothetical protein
MLNFLPGYGTFALAGLIAASAPIIIHLLNRRRFKTTEWAAMQFLHEAVRRNRRLLRIRDLILLALRTLALALFGLALARPFFSSTSPTLTPNQPIHAVLVVDNSLSMGYQKLDGSTLLDEAKSRVREFLEELPEGSIVSLIPLCGTPVGFSREAYRTKQDVRDALEQIQVADRSASSAQALDLAQEACRKHPDLPTKRVVLLGDQQRINWPADLAGQLQQLPDVQIVSLPPDEIENSWIASFRVQDGIADLDTPALFTAVIRHEGPSARKAVEVKLTINGSEVDSKVVDLEPGQAREVAFSYRFDIPVEEGRPTYVPAQVSIPHDRRREDDSRFLLVPVMSAVPVLFIDQYGRDESPQKNRYGETRALRRLMAASTSEGGQRQLVQVQHLKIDQVDRKALESARLVVIAGVADPGPAVPLLRDFVRQGGQLLIAAGGDFDAAAWTRSAWLDGAGILPAPLAEQPFGQTPEEAKNELKPFFLAFASMAHDYFRLADNSNEQMEDLYRRPFFFKAVVPDVSDPIVQTVRKTDIAQIEEERTKLAASTARFKKWSDLEAQGKLSDADKQEREQEEKRVAALRPNWLLWKPQEPGIETSVKPSELADRWKPHVLATYDNKMPFLIQRVLGQGQVLFVTTGVLSNWNTLPRENAILVFNRILRSMLENTLPQRNLSTIDSLSLPISDRHAMYQLIKPDGSKESLTVDALGSDQFGVTVRPQPQRGLYRVLATRIDATSGDTGGDRLLDVPLAVNGPEQESEPAVLDETMLKFRLPGATFRWVGRGEAIRLEGGQVSGQDLWKAILLVVLACLLLEMTVLAWPMLGRERAA